MKNLSLTSIKRPVIAILGRPNVGKSSLFNRLVGHRAAIVEDQPGVTRDRNYTVCDYRGSVFTLVDTGGLDPGASQGMLEKVRAQAQKAISESDILIVLFDGREGITALDELIVSMLRKAQPPVFYAANKIDTPKLQPLMADFYRLGINPLFPLSAERGMGIDDLMEEIILSNPGLFKESEETDSVVKGIPRIAVVGRPNVGKSTFVNRLLGEDRIITDSTPGTTRDAIDAEINYKGKTYLFIDTAGIRRRGKIDRGVERYSISRSLSAIDQCDLALVILDMGERLVEQDTKILGRVIAQKKGCIILVNKVDLAEARPELAERMEVDLKRKLRFIPFAPVTRLSALKGFNPRNIFEMIDGVMESYLHRITTGDLNRAFEKAMDRNPPPLDHGRPVRLNYVTQTQVAPPTFVIFSNRPRQVTPTYQRYLENFLRDEFGFMGVPLDLVFRQKKSGHLK